VDGGRGPELTVTDDAIERLREMIRSGAVKPGDKLPREPDLAEQLGVSRNSLREAVRALSLLRILDVRQGDGTYVTALAADTLLAALSVVIDFHGDVTLLEVLEVRRLLEPAATAIAAVRIEEATLDELEVILQRTTASSTVEELVNADFEFHRRIAAVARNAALGAILESLSGPTQRMRVWRGMEEEGALDRTFAEHRAILEALRNHDADLARGWATVHVAGVEDWLRANFEARNQQRDAEG
jgi:GntR family transcriptional regulator, transcriptional repressor for pyruvate dehydrogenase complex